MWLEILILALAVGVVYGHTLDVPFYLDDYLSIVENPSLSTWHDFQKIWQFAPLRVLGYFSFALNREWNGFNVAGYHVVNIVIHFMAGLSLLALAKGLLRTPVLRDGEARTALKWFPLITALLFLLHPLQSQAVTYIVQRLASLAGFFYLSAIACYLHGRLAKVKWPFFAACLISGLCAIFTKQNTVTLPLAILVMEVIFFRLRTKRLMQLLFFLVVGIGIGWFFLSGISGRNPFSLESMEVLTRETGQIPRIEYFATQMKVIWIYIRYFLFPIGLHLDHDVAVLAGFFNEQAILSLLGHILVMVLAYFSVKKNPILAFGIFFYYLAHLVESSLIPIRDVLFEHRTYLPNAGLCLAAGWFFTSKLPSLTNSKVAGWAAASILVALSILTWQQNSLWRFPVDLWSENARLAPVKYRVWDSLAQTLLDAGRNQEAAQALNEAMRLEDQFSGFTHWPSAINKINLLKREGKFDEALSTADFYLQKNPDSRVRAKILAVRGNLYIEKKEFPKAEQCFRESLSSYPDYLPAMANLGIVLFQQGQRQESRKIFTQVLAKYPRQGVAKKYLELIESSN
ncbi:MAG: tetratricopeptide repeat protein [Deltaproteobacteria bacterium]|nr:tetratricopeptide repeat protein [Deltaproteobacteria bacterium]